MGLLLNIYSKCRVETILRPGDEEMPAEIQKMFRQHLEEMDKLSPQERAARIKKLDQECICGMCPTYLGTGDERLTFCVIGKSSVIEKEKGCICAGCPVQTELALSRDYYCTKGSGKELAGIP